LDAEVDQRRLALLALELMGECRVHRFGEADFFQRRDLAGQRVGLWVLDVEGHGAPI
jgi:hypothetical protein